MPKMSSRNRVILLVLLISGSMRTTTSQATGEKLFALANSEGGETTEGDLGLLLYYGGTVCDDNFNDKAGDAICREMGYSHATEWKSGLLYEIQGYFEITLDDVDCNDEDWENCYFSEVHNCAHSEDVFLSCSS